MIKKIVVLLVLGFALFGVYHFVINSGKRNIETEKSEFSIDSKKVIVEFQENDSVANAKYLNKAIDIKGTITDQTDKQIILDGIVICELQSSNSDLKIGNKYKVKGRFLGYDDLMGEIKLDNCYLIK